MDIYLIRHTTPDIAQGICYGQSDLGLTEDFPKESKQIIAQLPSTKNYRVISSPLKRCTKLANQFSNHILLDDRLKELNFGDWELKAWHDIPEEDIGPWMNDFVNVGTPNGESYIQLSSRIQAFFEDLVMSETDNSIIIISHAGPIRALLSKLLDISLKDSFRIKIKYGEVFRLKKMRDSLKLVSKVEVKSG